MTACRRFATVSAAETKRRIDEGSAILVDIRDPHEHAKQHIAGARLVPLADLDTHDFDDDRAAGKAVIFHCQSGRRTELNAARLIATGFKEVYMLDGGLNAWRTAGLPVSPG
jgi:rhodanese-related sulfurtransferase